MPSDKQPVSGYRKEFDDDVRAERYDDQQYATSSWSSLLWEHEQEVLEGLLSDPDFLPVRRRYVDFACGTGRVIEVLATRFDDVEGVDISEAMLRRARRRLPGVRFVAGDVMRCPELVGANVDLVTMFRFLLNAEPADRLGALSWARGLLRDDASRIIVNNHGNLWTHKAIPYAVRRVRHSGGSVTGNVLSHRQVVSLVNAAGLKVERVIGLGYLGGHAQQLLGRNRMSRLQRRLSGVRWVQRLGEDQIYVLSLG